MVKVYVGDDEPAVVATRDALRAVSDPNRPVFVALAEPIDIALSFTLQIDPDYEAAVVNEAVRTALLEPQSEPFGIDVARIGDVLYDSEIYDACLRVPGVIAVHDLQLRRLRQQQQVIRMRQAFGFKQQYVMWNALPGIEAGRVPQSAFVPAPVQNIEVIRPLQQPLTTIMRRRIADATKIWNQRVEGTYPTAPPPTPLEIWNLEPGERHAPGEGRFYLLRGDRLNVATEVSRHGR
jgi:hypothetical protein